MTGLICAPDDVELTARMDGLPVVLCARCGAIVPIHRLDIGGDGESAFVPPHTPRPLARLIADADADAAHDDDGGARDAAIVRAFLDNTRIPDEGAPTP